MRTADYLTIALKDLRRQFLRSFLTIVALTISTIILVTMAALSIGGHQAITDQFGSGDALTTIAVTPNQNSPGLSPFGGVQEVNSSSAVLNDETTATLAKLPHVTSASPRAHLWEFHHFTIEGSEKQFVAQSEGAPSDSPVTLKAGTHFTTNDTPNVAILGIAYAKQLGLGDQPQQLIGKQIQLVTQKGYHGIDANIPPVGASLQANEAFGETTTTLTATIIGITDSGPDQNSLLVPLGWAHQIRTARYNEPAGQKTINQLERDGYTSIRVQTDDTANVSGVSAAITKLGYGQISALAELERLQQITTIMWAILGSVALVAAVAAALGVTNTMLMTVSEQRYTIGVWRAVGARRSHIIRMFLLQAGLLGLIGGAIGVGAGVAISKYVNDYVNTLLNAQGLTVTNIAVLPAWLLVGAIVLTTTFGIIAGLYPAYRAARQDPSEALRASQ